MRVLRKFFMKNRRTSCWHSQVLCLTKDVHLETQSKESIAIHIGMNDNSKDIKVYVEMLI